MRKIFRQISTAVLTAAMVTPTFTVPAAAEVQEDEYVIYPTVQSIEYKDGQSTIPESVNVVYGEGIDSFTKAHMEDVLSLLDVNVTYTDEKKDDALNILVGIEGTDSAAEEWFDASHAITAADLFDKTDSYALEVADGVIAILGQDTDAAFYGITSLKHIFTQVDGTIRHLVIEDYADVKTRGFIEGYYGNPWSHEDRIDLMKFGGNYKLNGYIYAPKDDPKHNSNWKGLYTEEELVKQAELAQAGNESKCYYIYALHPFMYDPIRFSSEDAYQEDLNIIKTKFEQLMKAGVKQFAILADDASVPTGGASSYVKLMTDLTNWLVEKQDEYEGLKSDMIFCPNDYMGWGTSSQMQTLKNLPDSVSIIQTGGQVWGQVGPSFNDTFYNNMGRPAFMWINWPCSDNTKDGLIMGGAEKVLKAGTNPDTIDGIVLNPMQQSEPSKQGLFTNADYAWNIWDDDDYYAQVWNDSFNYLDHGTIYETPASAAYRELSKHMKNSSKLYNEESEEIKDLLSDFTTTYNNGLPITEKAQTLKAEFTKLHEAALTFKNEAGNKRTLEQIIYWIDAWLDMTDAVNGYLDTAIAIENGASNATVWDLFSAAQEARDNSETHTFLYIDHYEKATPGRKYLTPFMNQLDTLLSAKVMSVVNPTIQTVTVITNRTDTPVGTMSSVTDNNSATEIIYEDPNSIAEGTYVGLLYEQPISVDEVIFRLGRNGNLKDTFQEAKVQYTTDGKEWTDYDGTLYSLPDEVHLTDMNLKGVKGIRMIATAGRTNTWLGIRDIVVNPGGSTTEEVTKSVSLDNLSLQINSLDNIVDDSMTTYAHLAEGNYKGDEYQDYIPVDASVTVEYSRAISLGTIHFLQDTGTDKLTRFAIEYTEDGETWTTLKEYDGDSEVTLDVSQQGLRAKAIRVRNLELNIQEGSTAGYWWKLYDFQANTRKKATPQTFTLPSGLSWYSGSQASLIDGDLSTYAWTDGSSAEGDCYVWDMGAIVPLGDVTIAMGAGDNDKLTDYALEYSQDGTNWTTYKSYSGVTSGQDVWNEDLEGVLGRYVRLRNLSSVGYWVKIAEFNISEYDPDENFSTSGLVTNASTDALVRTTAAYSELRASGEITLKSGQYIGIDTGKIREVEAVVKGTDNAALTLQTSRNGVDWVTVSQDDESFAAARYIRLINLGKEDVTFTLDENLSITTTNVTGVVLYDTDMGMDPDWGVVEDTRNNGAAFDGDVETTTEFGALPEEGQYIIYDLGQTRLINNIAMYCQDSALNYIRDAVIQVSEDLENWTDVVTIGDGVENKDDANVTCLDSDAGYKASSTYPNKVYVDGSVDNVPARYLRILFTASNGNRAVVFNEIVINNGEYVPVPDPAFTTNAVEIQNFAPANMFDGDLTTAWKPGSSAAGYLQYDFSANLDFNRINIIQKGTASNAKVSVLMEKDGVREWKEIGTLSRSLNELYVDADLILSIKFEWDADAIPVISEIITFKGEALEPDEPVVVNKTLLQQAVDYANTLTEEDFAHVNAIVIREFDDALAQAITVLNNDDASQEEVDASWKRLTRAIQMLSFTSDKEALNLLIEQAEALDLDEYEEDGKEEFAAALANAKEVAESETALDDTISAALIRLQNAMDALVKKPESVLDTSILEFLVETVSKIDRDLYTSTGMEAFDKALENAKAVLASPESQEQIDAAASQLNKAWLDLRLKPSEDQLRKIQDFIDRIDGLDLSAYSESSRTRILAVYTAGKEALANPDLSREEALKQIADQEALESILANPDGDLKDSIDPAVPAESVKPSDTTETVKPADTEETVKPADTNESVNQPAAAVQKTENTKSSASVKTAAGFGALGLGAMFAAGSAALAALLEKRRKH